MRRTGSPPMRLHAIRVVMGNAVLWNGDAWRETRFRMAEKVRRTVL
jgi:hypothetical protein